MESAILVSLYPGYLAFSYYSSSIEEKSLSVENESISNTSTIKKSLPWTR